MVLFIALSLATAAPKSAAPRDVVECFLSLPAGAKQLDSMPVEERKQALVQPDAVVDKKNGFLSFTTTWSAAGGEVRPYTIQVAVFQRKGLRPIVGVSNSFGGPVDNHASRGIAFYELIVDEAGEAPTVDWRDVTSDVLPSLELKDFWVAKKKPQMNPKQGWFFLRFELPREGTTVTVTFEVYLREHVDDGGNDVATAEETARDDAVRKAVSAGSRPLSLTWDAKRGIFLKAKR